MLYQNWLEKKSNGKKNFALLIDPDKSGDKALLELLNICQKTPPDCFLVGSSMLLNRQVNETVQILKKNSSIPIVLFPGDYNQISPSADALLFLSVISGRNAELLIGSHVVAAPQIYKIGIETISVGYMLFDSGKLTSVQYISQSLPLPNDKADLAVATALAGQFLGLKMLYLEAGSGAKNAVNAQIVKQVSRCTHIPIWVGGGIRTAETAFELYENGADCLVIGTKIEENPKLIADFYHIKEEFNQKKNE